MTSFRLSTRVQPAAHGQGRVRSPVRRAAPATAASEGVAAAATPVPWRVSARSESGVIEVEHIGSAPLHSVRFTLAGDGLLGLSLPCTVRPGERLRVVVRGRFGGPAAVAPDAMLVLRWFQPEGTELLWPIAL